MASLSQFYASKTVLVTGADKTFTLVVVRELIREVFHDIKKLYLIIERRTYVSEGDRTQQDLIREYAKNEVFEPLYGGHRDPEESEHLGEGFDAFVEMLHEKVEIISGDVTKGTTLGINEERCPLITGSVNVIIHGYSLVDPCDVTEDPEKLHSSCTGAGIFASRCSKDCILVLPGSLFAAAVARRYRSVPSFVSTITEDPSLGFRYAHTDAMPTPVIAAQSLSESSLSNLSTQGGTCRLSVVRYGLIGPPCLDVNNSFLSHGEGSAFNNVFSALACCIGVGAIDSIKVPNTESILEIIPLDMLAERVVGAAAVMSQNQRVSVVHAATSHVHSLAVRMAARYLTEYFVRNHKALASSLDYGVPAVPGGQPIRIPLSPLLTTHPRLDIIDTSTSLHRRVSRTAKGVVRMLSDLPVQYFNSSISSHLERHPHTGAAERYRGALTSSLGMVRNLENILAASQLSFSSSAILFPDSKMDIREIEWELYCKNTARSSFISLCSFVGVSPGNIPPALKYCMMDRLTMKPGDSFGSWSVLQKLFPDVHFLMSCTKLADGHTVQYKQGLSPSRREEILRLDTVRSAIKEQAAKERVTEDAIIARSYLILDRVGDKLNVQTIRLLGIALRKAMQTIYTHVHTNDDAYDRVRRAYRGVGSLRPIGKRAVVLIPSHRSYMDFLVVSYLMYMWGLPVPHICAGEDFLRLAGVSKLLRGSGAFFMRRSFKGDHLYGTLFREYSRLLATDGRVIEFFIEGARSRMGKTLSPKVGILKVMVEALTEAVRTGNTEFTDVLLVPVSLSYDKVLEGSIYVRELTGGKKPPETLSNLISAASVLKKKFGTLNVTVNEPISLAEYIIKNFPAEGSAECSTADAKLTRSVAALDSTTSKTLLNRLAWDITSDLQSGLIVTPTALLSAALLYLHLPSEIMEGIRTGVVVSEIVWLRELVLKSGGKMKPSTTHQSGEELFTYAASMLNPFVEISSLNRISIENVDTLLLLSIYANQVFHLFVDEAIVTLTAAASVNTRVVEITSKTEGDQEDETKSAHEINRNLLSSETLFLKDLMSVEAPNYSSTSPLSHDEWFIKSLTRYGSLGEPVQYNSTVSDSAVIRIHIDTQLTGFLTGLLHPLVEVYWFVAVSFGTLLGSNDVKIREPNFMERLGVAADLLLEKDELQFISVRNREVLKNSISKFKQHRVIASAGASQSLTLLPDYSTPDKLNSLVRSINALRWKPSTDLSAVSNLINSHINGPKL